MFFFTLFFYQNLLLFKAFNNEIIFKINNINTGMSNIFCPMIHTKKQREEESIGFRPQNCIYPWKQLWPCLYYFCQHQQCPYVQTTKHHGHTVSALTSILTSFFSEVPLMILLYLQYLYNIYIYIYIYIFEWKNIFLVVILS